MAPAPLVALPPDVMGCVARAALAAEGDDAHAWARLSLVCRTWRDSLSGARPSAFTGCVQQWSIKKRSQYS